MKTIVIDEYTYYRHGSSWQIITAAYWPYIYKLEYSLHAWGYLQALYNSQSIILYQIMPAEV